MERNFWTGQLPTLNINQVRVAILADFPLHVIPEFGEEFRPGGHFATWLPQLCEAFREFPDLDAHWIVMSDRIRTSREVRWNNQTFHILPTSPTRRASTLFAKDRRAINDCLKEIQPHLVHGWGTEDVYALAAVTSGFPNIVSMQGILSYYILKNRMPLRVYFQALLEMYILRRANLITTESAWGRNIVLRRNPRATVELVEYGVLDRFLEIPWQPDPQKPAAIFVGSIVARKGIQDAVAAFCDPALAHAELWIVGGEGAELEAALRAQSTPNIKWLGRLPSAEVADLLSRAWCLVLPTRADTSPNVVKEARVIGLPVISTPHGGQITYIQEGKNGFLVEPGDIKSLTKALGELLSSFDKTTAMGRLHHEEHRHLLHPRRTAESFYALYKNIAASNSN